MLYSEAVSEAFSSDPTKVERAWAVLIPWFKSLLRADQASRGEDPTDAAQSLARIVIRRAEKGEFRFENDARLRSYLQTTLRRRAISKWRWRQADALHHSGPTDSEPESFDEFDFLRHLENLEYAGAIHEHLRSAVAPVNFLIWTMYLDGVTARETAGRLGKTQAAIEKIIQRVRLEAQKACREREKL